MYWKISRLSDDAWIKMFMFSRKYVWLSEWRSGKIKGLLPVWTHSSCDSGLLQGLLLHYYITFTNLPTLSKTDACLVIQKTFLSMLSFQFVHVYTCEHFVITPVYHKFMYIALVSKLDPSLVFQLKFLFLKIWNCPAFFSWMLMHFPFTGGRSTLRFCKEPFSDLPFQISGWNTTAACCFSTLLLEIACKIHWFLGNFDFVIFPTQTVQSIW
jgi:hypothetical protein